MIELESHNFATPNKLICIIKKKKNRHSVPPILYHL